MVSKIQSKAAAVILLSFILAALKKRLKGSHGKNFKLAEIEVTEAFSKPLPEITIFKGSLINE